MVKTKNKINVNEWYIDSAFMIASIITTAICKLMTVFNVLIIYVVQVKK